MKKGGLLDEVQDGGCKEDVDDGQFKEDHPAELHHLVIAEAGERPPHPDEEEGEEEKLEDHYNPADKTVNLSESVYNSNSIAAAAVAAHEVGHAVQHAQAYHWLGLRSALVPIVQLSSNLVGIVLMIGIVLLAMGGSPWVLGLGIGLFAVTTAFAFITLPVEFDASARALKWLDRSHLMNYFDHGRAKSALFWAAMTYVVGALSSLAMLLYYVFIFLNARGRE